MSTIKRRLGEDRHLLNMFDGEEDKLELIQTSLKKSAKKYPKYQKDFTAALGLADQLVNLLDDLAGRIADNDD